MGVHSHWVMVTVLTLFDCRSPDVTIGSDDGEDIFADFPPSPRSEITFCFCLPLILYFHLGVL